MNDCGRVFGPVDGIREGLAWAWRDPDVSGCMHAGLVRTGEHQYLSTLTSSGLVGDLVPCKYPTWNGRIDARPFLGCYSFFGVVTHEICIV